MKKDLIIAIMYDFDKTLSPKDMQEYAFIPKIGLKAEEFWGKCNDFVVKHKMDPILAYMWLMINEARGKVLVTKDAFNKLGKKVDLLPGVKDWFARVNHYGKEKGVIVEHYIISSGLKEIIEGTSIANEFKEIYAANFCYDDSNVAVWPAMAVNYTSKTQFLFRINKGVLDVTENNDLNEYTAEGDRRVPFRNMIYIGDGLTDVPCMKLVKMNGGHSIAVYQEDCDELASDMILQGRVDYALNADYSKDSEMENTVFTIIDQVVATHKSLVIQNSHYKKATRYHEKKIYEKWDGQK